MAEKNLSDVKEHGIDGVSGVIAKAGVRQHVVASNGGAFVTSTPTLVHTDRYQIEQNTTLYFAVHAEDEDYAGGDSITVRFYMDVKDSTDKVQSQVEDVVISTAAAVDGKVGIVEINDSLGIIPCYTHVSFAGDLTVAAGGRIKATLLGKTTAS
jgi:hypothetical protein